MSDQWVEPGGQAVPKTHPSDPTNIPAAPASGSGESGLLAARPAASSRPNNSTYFATDDNLGTTYRLVNGVWVKQAAAVGDASGRELGATILATSFNSGNAADTAFHDVPGMQVTVTVGARPIKVTFNGSVAFQMGTSAAAIRRVNLQLVDADTSTVLTNQAWTVKPTATSETWYLPVTVSKRLAPAAGVHTYKLQYAVNVAGAIVIISGSDLGIETILEVVER